jgi:hypothetical protein
MAKSILEFATGEDIIKVINYVLDVKQINMYSLGLLANENTFNKFLCEIKFSKKLLP